MTGGPVIGTWEDVFSSHSAEVQAIGLALRDLILSVHPGAVMVARPGDNGVTFGTGPRKMLDGYIYLAPHQVRVNFGFYQGAHLADPSALMQGTGTNLRHIKVVDLATVGWPEMRDLVQQALARQREIEGARG